MFTGPPPHLSPVVIIPPVSVERQPVKVTRVAKVVWWHKHNKIKLQLFFKEPLRFCHLCIKPIVEKTGSTIFKNYERSGQ